VDGGSAVEARLVERRRVASSLLEHLGSKLVVFDLEDDHPVIGHFHHHVVEEKGQGLHESGNVQVDAQLVAWDGCTLGKRVVFQQLGQELGSSDSGVYDHRQIAVVERSRNFYVSHEVPPVVVLLLVMKIWQRWMILSRWGGER